MSEYSYELQIAVCDDDPLMLERLAAITQKSLSGQYTGHIHRVSSPTQLLALKKPLHLVVLDIELPESDGISLASDILSSSPSCQVIFVSGYVRYVSDVYDVPHICLILKDQLEQQLPKFLLRAAATAVSNAGKTLKLKDFSVPVADVSYMERQGHWTHIYLSDGALHRTREKLTDLTQRVANPALCRCHISYVVNLAHIKALENDHLTLQSDQILPVSRPYRKSLRSAFFQYLADHT